MPRVSVVLPTYNRADTIVRAIRSVIAQTFTDWELIVIDDGSTDGTFTLLANLDPRVIVIRQENRGFTEARNAGIRTSRGDYVAFIDSDDEFLPHHLELCAAFLDAFPNAPFVATELLENFGGGHVVSHYSIEVSDWYPKSAARLGSRMFDLPSGESDDYLRVYEARERIGPWGRAIAERVGATDAYLYRGRIFEYLRWGFLITITATVIRRSAFDVVGLPQTRWRTGSDFHFMASLCRAFETNYVAVPTFVKHELSPDGTVPAFGHVVTGRTALTFSQEWLRAWEDFFWTGRDADGELDALHASRLYEIAKMAVVFGERELALQYLKDVRKSRRAPWQARALDAMLRAVRRPELTREVVRVWNRVAHAYRRLRTGELVTSVLKRRRLHVSPNQLPSSRTKST